MNTVPLKTQMMATTTLFPEETAPEVFRVGVTTAELMANQEWDDLRKLLMTKGIPLYKLVEGANFRQIIVADGVILEFE